MDNEDKSHIYTSVAEALLANSEYQEAMQRALEPLRKIAQQYTLPVQQQLSENLRKSMEPILNISKFIGSESPAFANLQKAAEDLKDTIRRIQIPPETIQALKTIDWDYLKELEDDEVASESMQDTFRQLEDSVNPAAPARSSPMTKSDIMGLLSLVLVLLQFFFGSPYEWVQDAEAAKHDDKELSVQEQTLDTLQQIAELIQVNQEITLDIAQSLEDDVEPNTVTNDCDQESQADDGD